MSLTATVSSARERECIMSDPDLLDITFGFGTSLEGRSPVCMLNEHDVIYSLGKKIVLHNLNKNMQMVLPMTPRTKSISAFEACSRKRYLAVCEIPATPSEPPQVSILDLESSPVKRLRTLLNVTDDGELAQTGTAYLDVGFSADSKLVVAICNEPKYTIVVWEWFRTRRVGAYDIRTQVSRVRFNPFDAAQVSTSGNNHLRLWKVQENVLKAYPAFQGLPTGLNITDHSWTQDDRMVAISDRADVFVIDEGIIVQEISNIHPNCANEKLASFLQASSFRPEGSSLRAPMARSYSSTWSLKNQSLTAAIRSKLFSKLKREKRLGQTISCLLPYLRKEISLCASSKTILVLLLSGIRI